MILNSGIVVSCALLRNGVGRSFMRQLKSMDSVKRSSYEEAIYALNGLQSNSETLKKSREERSINPKINLSNTEKHLYNLGIHAEDLNSLNIVHVSGTNGKGSTCAFTEAILRQHGYRTGFYSSPHIISVNERIRINGRPLDKEAFSNYFWKVYKSIQQNLKHGETMPPYFMFLTIMAFYVFVKENIQAAVIEVGIGGLYDCTNIVSKPVVVGVTTLGMDHMSLLGNTITDIAEQKAGIFKTGVPAFTVPQPEKAMHVLRHQAEVVGCPLALSPPFEAYQQSCDSLTLGSPGIVQIINASLALQLAKTWLDSKQSVTSVNCNNIFHDDKSNKQEETHLPLSMASVFPLTLPYQNALQTCSWPGRYQTVESGQVTFFLDGAHTYQSMKHCVKWFEDASRQHALKLQKPILRLLLFNCTGERKAENLLDPLADVHFDMALFSPNRISIMKDSSSDGSNFMVDPKKEMEQCTVNREIWCHLMRSIEENGICRATQSNSLPILKQDSSDGNNTVLFSCLSSVMDWILDGTSESDSYLCNSNLANIFKESDHIQILVTGSLHLVGGVLSIIQSKLQMNIV